MSISKSKINQLLSPLALFAVGYIPLEPGILDKPANTPVQVKEFVYLVFNQFLIVAAVLAVLMIVFGGFQYITSSASGKTAAAKERIQNALLGLVLALVAYALLHTINPQLVNYDEVLKEPESSQPPASGN